MAKSTKTPIFSRFGRLSILVKMENEEKLLTQQHIAKPTKKPIFLKFGKFFILVKMEKSCKISKIWQNRPKHPFSLDLEDCPFLSKWRNLTKSAKYGKINQNIRFL